MAAAKIQRPSAADDADFATLGVKYSPPSSVPRSTCAEHRSNRVRIHSNSKKKRPTTSSDGHAGRRYTEPPPFDLPACYDDSENITPLVFILSTGSDPNNENVVGYNNKKCWRDLSVP